MAGESKWEDGFRASVRTKRIGWTVNNKDGRIQLKVRQKGLPQQTRTLPLAWDPDNQAAALQLIGRIYQLVASSEETLHRATEICLCASDTLAPARSWPDIAASLRDALQSGRNEIEDQTWTTNYAPYIKEALRLLNSSKPPKDGHELLKRTLEKWSGKPPSRATCCIAIRNLTDHGIARFHLESCWRIDRVSIKELKGKPAKKRIKATLEDSQLLYLIGGIEKRNPGWANVIRLLALFGLRPIELQHIRPKKKSDGSIGLWCSYAKNCGGTLTEPRWLEPYWIRDANGEVQDLNLIGALHDGILVLPRGNDGQTRVLNGHYVEQFLRIQPEWIELKAHATTRGEWLRPYTFRDSYSLRCHRYEVEAGSIARAMGHSLAVHSSSYRWSSDDNTAAAFAKAMPV